MSRKKKYYFENEDAENCYTEEFFQELMQDEGVQEMEVFEAIPERIEEAIWCMEHGVVERGDCGRFCNEYQPRNGKSGMCKNQGRFCVHGEKVTLRLKTPTQKGGEG